MEREEPDPIAHLNAVVVNLAFMLAIVGSC